MRAVFAGVALAISATQAHARARDLGIPFEGTPGPLNAIADIRGVEVGQATEEAIVNAFVAARTMTGANGTRYFGLPPDELRAIPKRYNRLEGPGK